MINTQFLLPIPKLGTPKQAIRFHLPSKYNPVIKITQTPNKAGLTFHQGPFCTSSQWPHSNRRASLLLSPSSTPSSCNHRSPILWLPHTTPPAAQLSHGAQPSSAITQMLSSAPAGWTPRYWLHQVISVTTFLQQTGPALTQVQLCSRALRRGTSSPGTVSFEETGPLQPAHIFILYQQLEVTKLLRWKALL